MKGLKIVLQHFLCQLVMHEEKKVAALINQVSYDFHFETSLIENSIKDESLYSPQRAQIYIF